MGWSSFGAWPSRQFSCNCGRCFRLRSLLSFAHLGHEIPTPPALNSRVPLFSQDLIIRVEEMHKILGIEEHCRFLLALDSIAVFLWWFESFSKLLWSWSVNVEVRQMTNIYRIFV